MLRDLLPSLRSFFRRPGFLAATVLPLAGGLGAAIAVFSVVYRLLLGPLGLGDADRVMALSQNLPELGGSVPMSAASLVAISEHQSVFQSIASLQVTDRTLTEWGDPTRIKVASVTPSFFPLGATKPALGRIFDPADARLSSSHSMVFGDGPVAVLSDSLWRARFGADPGVIGRSIALEGRRYEIVGVMPPQFRYPLEAQVWLPLGFGSLAAKDFGDFYFQTIARLKPGTGVDQVRRDLEHVAALLQPESPSFTHGLTFEVETLRQRLVGDRRTPTLLLFGLTLVIVLGVSANTAQILLARILAQQRDLALRLSLGAPPSRVTRLVFAEGVALALLGWCFGIALAGLVLSFFSHAVPLQALGLTGLGLNGPAVVFSLIIALASGLVLGFVPILAMRQRNLVTYLREGATQSSPGPRQRQIHRLLLSTQLALALILVASGTFLLASFTRLQSLDLKFDPTHVATLDLTLPDTYTPPRLRSFVSEAVQTLRALPGVSAAAVAMRVPVLDEGGGIWFYLPDHPETRVEATFNTVTPGFFSTLRVPVRAGVEFSDHDRDGGEPVAIIDETLARRFFASENPIGRFLVLTPWPKVQRRIVGVVSAVKFGGLRGEFAPTVYVPTDQIPWGRLRLVVRTEAPPATILAAARKRIWDIDPRLAFDAIGTYQSRIEALSSPDRWALRLVLALGILGLVLSGSCIYAMTTQLVSQRFRELAIRLALGSPPSRLIRHVISERLPDLVIGLVLGLAGVWMIGRWARSVLFEVSPLDPLLLGVSVVILAGAALLALFLPARRAARIDPITILR
ncbi:MAG TPA: ADOP family duplicated permease [Thermoanaerobaculia bacterium]|jgi:putative ABC transport system permease protein|nr:ADOP family duplicated permease [Thermoanaerobaculia bacterium]